MAMKAYSQNSYSQRYVTYGFGGGTTIENRLVAGRSLSNVFSQEGDFRTPNPHTYTKMSWRGLVGSMRQVSSGHFVMGSSGVWHSPFIFSLGWADDFDPSALNSAYSSAYEKLRGTVDLSIDLVQWKKVIQMVSLHRRLLRGISDAGKNILSKIELVERRERELSLARTKRSAKRVGRLLNKAANQLADARLEYVYGWSPTMSTIYELGKGILLPDAPGMLVCKGVGKTLQKRTVNGYYVNNKVPVVHHVTISDRARVEMYFTPQPSVLDNLGKISALNPLSVVYEAIPFSFVLDWAYDISGWLRTLETAFLHRNDFAGGYQTRTQRCESVAIMVGTDWSSTSPTAPSYIEYALRGGATRTRFARSTLSTPPYPVKPVKQFQLGTGRMLNAIALSKATLLRADGKIASHLRR